VVAALVLNLVCVSFVGAQQTPTKQNQRVNKLKEQIALQKRWTPQEEVAIKLRDGTKLKGHIAEVFDDHFVLTDRNGQSIGTDYSQVKDVKGVLKEHSLLAIIGGVPVMLVLMSKCVITKRCAS
jgi:sRNA-binding regulator protein Hfq